jgi:hypothetical protein
MPLLVLSRSSQKLQLRLKIGVSQKIARSQRFGSIEKSCDQIARRITMSGL